MQIKQIFFIPIFLLFSCNIMHSYDYPYECVDESTPSFIKTFFTSSSPEGILKYHGQDHHKRYLVELIDSGKESIFYALHVADDGKVWTSFINKEHKNETYFIKIKIPGTDEYSDCHPRAKMNSPLIPKENKLYPPKDLPKFENYTLLDFYFVEEDNTPAKETEEDTDNNNNSYDMYDDDHRTPTPEPSSFLGIGKASWLPSLFWTTTALTFAFTYYYLFTNLTEYNRFLVREDTWSTWKRNKESYETLLQIEPKRLASLLIEDINTVYYQEPNPVKLFLEDIAQEYEKLSHAIQVRNIAINLWLPVHDIFYTLEDRLCLLNHLRSAVHAWRAKEFKN